MTGKVDVFPTRSLTALVALVAERNPGVGARRQDLRQRKRVVAEFAVVDPTPPAGDQPGEVLVARQGAGTGACPGGGYSEDACTPCNPVDTPGPIHRDTRRGRPVSREIAIEIMRL